MNNIFLVILTFAFTTAVCLGLFIPLLVYIHRSQAREASQVAESLGFQTQKADWAIEALRVATRILGPPLGSNPLTPTDDMWTRWFRAHLLNDGSWLDASPETDAGSRVGRWVPDWERQRELILSHRSKVEERQRVGLDAEIARINEEIAQVARKLGEAIMIMNNTPDLDRLKVVSPNRYRAQKEVRAVDSHYTQLTLLQTELTLAGDRFNKRVEDQMLRDGFSFPTWAELDRAQQSDLD